MNLFHTGEKVNRLRFRKDVLVGHGVKPILASPANRTHPDLNNGMNGSVVYVNCAIFFQFGEMEYHVLEPKFVNELPPIPLHVRGEKTGQ